MPRVRNQYQETVKLPFLNCNLLRPSIAPSIRHARTLSPPKSRKTRRKASGEPDSAQMSQSEVEKIFGEPISAENGVEILAQLQEQRRKGTLDQDTEFPPHLVKKGLVYLRQKYEVDEDVAIVARIDKEVDLEWNLPQKNPNRSPTSVSRFQELREHNMQKYAKEKARIEAEEKKREEELLQEQETEGRRNRALISRDKDKDAVAKIEPGKGDGRVLFQGKRVLPETVRLYKAEEQKGISQQTTFDRLAPSALFTGAIIVAALLFVSFYTPPSPEGRLFREAPPAAAFVAGIISINLFIWLAWKIPGNWKYLNRFCMIVPANPRAFSMLGSEFSHHKFNHIFGNMVAMWWIGTTCKSPLLWDIFKPSQQLTRTESSARRHRTRSPHGPYPLRCRDPFTREPNLLRPQPCPSLVNARCQWHRPSLDRLRLHHI